MNSSLALDQSQLLQVLAGLSGSPVAVGQQFNQRGLQVYRANRAVLAERTLASTYPVISQLVGPTSFEPMAQQFWRQHPPVRGDMAQWGAELPEFLEAAAQLADEPFLADVARLEWALHRAAAAPDAALDAPSFSLLADSSAHRAGLVLSPGVATLASAWPVVSIINAHLVGQPTLSEAGELLRQSRAEHALVWRQGLKPRLRGLCAAEYGLINTLVAGESVVDALDAAARLSSAFDFNTWLAQAVQTGLVTGAAQLPT